MHIIFQKFLREKILPITPKYFYTQNDENNPSTLKKYDFI